METPLNFEELHSGGNNTCEVNPQEPGRDSGYGTDNAHRASTPTSAINSIRDDQEILTRKYRSLDEFDKPLFVIAHGYIFGGDIDFTDNEEHKKIYGEALWLTNKMRGECPTHFENFVGRLDRAFEGSDVIDPSVWFSLSFEELIKKVGESPSWRSFANILNCIYIVKSVAEKKHQFNLTLQTSMEDVLMRFIKDKFRLYIQNVGGWQNLVEYVDNIRKWPVEGESLIDNLSLSSWAATALTIGAVIAAGFSFLTRS